MDGRSTTQDVIQDVIDPKNQCFSHPTHQCKRDSRSCLRLIRSQFVYCRRSFSKVHGLHTAYLSYKSNLSKTISCLRVRKTNGRTDEGTYSRIEMSNRI